MKIVYLGQKQAGCIGLLTLKALGHDIVRVSDYDQMVYDCAQSLGIACWWIKDFAQYTIEAIQDADLLVSVHARHIVPVDLLKIPGINVHPYLYAYKGKNPVERALNDGNYRASVGVHRMTNKVDEGEVITELFVDASGTSTVAEVYNILYPYYSLALIDALSKI